MTVAALCPGSFDPVHNGHLDVIERAAGCFDALVVGCLRNPGKSPLLPLDERVELLEQVTAHLPNVQVASFAGLLVDFCRERGIGVVVKGLRGVGDFEVEQQMARMNRHLTGVETFFMATQPSSSFLSSSLVKEVARLGGDVSELVPKVVAARLAERLAAS